MTDTVKIEMSQIDEATGTRISYALVEWVGSERDVANVMSMSLVNAIAAAVNTWRGIQGVDPVQVVIEKDGKVSAPNYGKP